MWSPNRFDMRPAQYRFHDFELDVAHLELRHHHRVVKVEPIPFELLVLLVEAGGNAVTHEAIVDCLWGPDVQHDTKDAVESAIRKLRQTLHDDPLNPQYVQTIVGQGYRFIAPVTVRSRPRAAEGDEDEAPVRSWRRSTPVWPWVLTALLLLLIGGAAAWWRRRPAAPPVRNVEVRTMLAVIPFADLSGDPEQRYFGYGLAEEIIAGLGRLDPLHLDVIARTSVMRYAETTTPIGLMGRQLQADYLVEGSVRRDQQSVAITAQLIRARDSSQIWAQSFDREDGALQAIERGVAAAIAREVRGQSPKERAPAPLPARPINAEAHRLYLQGRDLWNRRTGDGLKQSLARFESALGLDPSYAAALAGLADAYVALVAGDYLSPSEAFPKARDAAQKALMQDPNAPEPHALLGYVNMYFDRDFRAAEAQFQKAIELNPSYAAAHDWYGMLLLALGRGAEARAELDRAIRVDLFSPFLKADTGFLFHLQGLDQQAIKEFTALAADPSAAPLAHFWLGRVYAAGHRCHQALAEIAAVGTALQDWPPALAARAYALGVCGQRAEAESLLQRLQQPGDGSYAPSYSIALIYNGMGQKAEAVRWLRKAYDEHSPWLVWLSLDPRWNDLRHDPAFDQLRKQLGPAA